MAKKEIIKGVIGVLWAISVGLCALIGEYCSALTGFFVVTLAFLYILQIAVVPYAHRFVHNNKWYSATLITLCVLNVFYCAIIAGIIVSIKPSNNPLDELGAFALMIILIPMSVITLAIIIASIISYNKRKGSFH